MTGYSFFMKSIKDRITPDDRQFDNIYLSVYILEFVTSFFLSFFINSYLKVFPVDFECLRFLFFKYEGVKAFKSEREYEKRIYLLISDLLIISKDIWTALIPAVEMQSPSGSRRVLLKYFLLMHIHLSLHLGSHLHRYAKNKSNAHVYSELCFQLLCL